MAKKSTDLQIAFVQKQIAHYYLQGKTQQDMADDFGVSLSTVRRHIKLLREEWKERALYDFSIAKSEELAKVDEIERIAWDQFHKSLAGKEVATTMDNGTTVTEMMSRTTTGTSDIKWLDKIQWCVDQRCKILGLHAPKQAVINQTIREEKNLEEMSTEELLKIANQKAVNAMYDVSEGVEVGTEKGEVELLETV